MAERRNMGKQIEGQMELEEYLRKINRENFNVLDYIPTGSANAVERAILRFRTGLRDRQMRKLIHFARREIPILNMQDGKGYFIPDMNSEKDIRLLVRYVLQEESRLQRIGWSLKSARQTLRNCGIDWHDPKWQKKKKRTRKAA